MSAQPEAAGAAPRIAAASAGLALLATTGAAVLVPLAYFPPLEAPFVAPKTALLYIAAALAFVAFALHRSARPGARLFPRPVAWGFALVLASTLASWAIAAGVGEETSYAPSAVARWCALFGLACGSVIVAREAESRRALLEAATIGAAVMSVLGLWQHFEITPLPIPMTSAPGSTFGNRNFGGEAVALSLPLGIAAWALARAEPQRRRFAGVLAGALVVEVVYLAATRTRGAWLGAVVGLGTLFASWRPRLSRRELATALVVLALAAVAGLAPGPRSARIMGDVKRSVNGVEVAKSAFDPQSPAFHVRVGFWRRSLRMWREHPIWGVGPGNWPVWFPRYAEPGSRREGVMTAYLVPRQAHDDLLERGGETGAAGVVALLVLAVVVARAARRRARAGEPEALVPTVAGAGVLAALVGCGVTGFPLEMPGTLTLAALGLGLCAGDSRPDAEPGPPSSVRAASRRLTVALSGVLLVFAVIVAERQVRGSYWLRVAVRTLQQDQGRRGGVDALVALEKASALTPGSYRVWLRRAEANLRIARPQAAQSDAERAIAIEPWATPAWASLATAQLQKGDPRAAAESATQALFILADLPEALLARAQACAALGDPNAANLARRQLELLARTPSPDKKTATAAASLLAQLDHLSVRDLNGPHARH